MLCDDAPEVRLHVGPGGDEAGLVAGAGDGGDRVRRALSRQDRGQVGGGLGHPPVAVLGRGRAGIALISTKKKILLF